MKKPHPLNVNAPEWRKKQPLNTLRLWRIVIKATDGSDNTLRAFHTLAYNRRHAVQIARAQGQQAAWTAVVASDNLTEELRAHLMDELARWDP